MNRSSKPVIAIGSLLLGSAIVAACGGGSSSSSSKSAATAVPVATRTATAAGSSSSPSSAPASTTKEVENVKTVRPVIDQMTAAFQKADLKAARDAYELYDSTWNGIEVYVNYRDRAMYGDLETDLQAKIADALSADKPNFPALVTLSQQLAKRYDDAIALVTKGPALSPLFDDLATLRIVRADLRVVTAALGANDVSKAKTYFAKFKANYSKAQPLVQQRSATAEPEVRAALAAADAKFQQPAATVDELKPLVATLTDRYNFGVNLLNAAARNTNLEKKAVTDADKQDLAALNELQNQLLASVTAWNTGDYARAAAAKAAADAAFQKVQANLAARSADAPLKTALDNYGALAGAAGDEVKAASTNKAAIEQASIAQQVIAGQFWTDPALKSYLATLPTA